MKCGHIAGTIEEKLINSTTKQRIKLLPKKGRLFKLSPFYDPDNKVVRVGGRLANLPYNIDKNPPILIPKDSPITVLLIREAHARNLHGGPHSTLFYLRETVWISGWLSAIGKFIYKCNPFICHDARILQLQMEICQQNVCYFIVCFQPHWFGLLWTFQHKRQQRITAEDVCCPFCLFQHKGCSYGNSDIADQRGRSGRHKTLHTTTWTGRKKIIVTTQGLSLELGEKLSFGNF